MHFTARRGYCKRYVADALLLCLLIGHEPKLPAWMQNVA
jgi:hypothetical protein